MTDIFSTVTEEIPKDLQDDLGADYIFTEADVQSGGEFEPRILPGTVYFRFEVTDHKEPQEGETAHQITYTAHVQVADLGPGRLRRDTGQSEVPITYNRIWVRPPERDPQTKEFKSKPYDLIALHAGLHRKEGKSLLAEQGPADFKEMLRRVLEAGSGTHFAKGSLIWESYKKFETGPQVFSTSPRKGRNPQNPWPPRDENNQLPISVTFADGDTKTAQEKIGRVYAIKAKGAK
jgi:hypothetical protein